MSRGSIAERVLGITDPADQFGSIEQAYCTLTGEPYNPFQPAFDVPPSYQHKEWFSRLSVNDQERYLAVRDVESLMLTGAVENASTLTSWHAYDTLMRKYGTKVNGTGTALLIGSLNALSSRSFVCLAEDVYGADKTIIVDPKGGKDKARHGTFIEGNA